MTESTPATPPNIIRPPEVPNAALLLDELGLPYARDGADEDWVSTLYLVARRRRAVFFAMPQGARADFGRLARHLALPRLRCAHKLDLLWSSGQSFETLSPFGAVNAEIFENKVVLDESLLARPRLGLPTDDGPGMIWLSPETLCEALTRLGLQPEIGAFTDDHDRS
jgi:hypothetical protein